MLKLHNRSAVSENIQIPKIHTLTLRTLENSSISVPVYLNLGGPTPSCSIALPFCQLYERATPATLSQKTAQTLTPINLEHFLLLVCTNCQPVNRRLSTDDNSRLQFLLCIQVKNKYAKQNTVFELQFNFFEKTFRISGFTICSLPTATSFTRYVPVLRSRRLISPFIFVV